LAWDRPQRIREIQITFDSGFQRQLTLTASDSHSNTTIRAPQPETVRDYKVLADGKALAEVKGNHQRVNRHRTDGVEARSIRIAISATNGAPDARVFEVRCYA